MIVWWMLEYYGMIRSLYPDAVLIQQVLYVGDRRPSFETNIAEETLQFRYNVQDIRAIDCRQLLASPSLKENLLAIRRRLTPLWRRLRDPNFNKINRLAISNAPDCERRVSPSLKSVIIRKLLCSKKRHRCWKDPFSTIKNDLAQDHPFRL